jgi:hypothetical protein
LGLLKRGPKASGMKFMQKFYHKGAFYQDGEVIDEKLLNRNFQEATGFDKVCLDAFDDDTITLIDHHNQ